MDYQRIALSTRSKSEILALGAQSKSSFCFLKGGVAYLSESRGDLSDLKNFEFFKKEIERSKKKLKIKPKIIACDLHPEYISTKYANSLVKGEEGRVKMVQHHEAHVASCIVDNNIKGKVIGVAFDGTGLGLDGNIWGGEFFVGGVGGFKRMAHLRYIPMPGGEAAINQPWRMALSYLYSVYRTRFRDLKIGFLGFLTRLEKARLELLIQIINKRINSPLTSSMGRLFDAVSSIIGICNVAEYEAQAAIGLEKIVGGGGWRVKGEGKYDFKYRDKDGVIIIDWSSAIKGVVKDLEAKKTKASISLKFHNAVCNMIKEVCNLLRKRYKISKVCFSGGVFQNRYLMNHVKPILEKEKLEAYFHKNLPNHDGNIALGQVVIASNKE